MSEVFTLDMLDKAVEAAKNGPRIHPIIMDGREVYLMTVTPRMRAVLVMIKAKAAWKRRYRAERIAKKKAQGFVYLDTKDSYEDWNDEC